MPPLEPPARLSTSLSVLGVKAAGYVLGGITAIILARALGPYERGIWAICMLVAGFLAILADLGVGSSAAFYLSSSDQRSDEIISTSLTLAAGLAAGTYLLAVLFLLNGGKRAFPGVPETPLLLATASVLVVVPTAVARQAGLAYGGLALQNKSSLVQALLLLALMGAGALVGVRTPTGFAVLYLAGLVLTSMATLSWLRRQYLRRVQLNRRFFLPLVTYGLKAHVAAMGLFLAYRLDILIVNYLVGPTGAGLYAVALTLSELLRGLPETAQAVVVSRFRHDDFIVAAAATTRVVATATLLAGVGLVLTAKWVVPFLFGWRYAPAADAFLWLVPGVVALAFSYSLSPILLRAGEVGVSAIAAICGTVVMVGLDLVLVPRFGIAGAAFGSSVAYVTLASIQIRRLIDRGDITLAELRPRLDELRSVFTRRPQFSGGSGP
jgi:O-antigen/teichoic acid export membrane protein